MSFTSTQSLAKELAEDYAHKIWNNKDIRFVDQSVSHDVCIHSLMGESHGIENMKSIIHAWLTGFPDLQVTNEIIIGEYDLVSIQWRAKGTHLGEFKEIKPTGKSVAYNGVTVYRIRENKIIEYWAYLDMMHLLNQISEKKV